MSRTASRCLISILLAPTLSRTTQRWQREHGKRSWMKWQLTGFRQRRNGVREDFGVRLTSQSETDRSPKQPLQNCSPFFILMGIAWPIIFDDFTTWPLILAGSPGPSSPNEPGPK